ncbi:uncharacterized protein LOC144440942 [Glandiceps talaboti]
MPNNQCDKMWIIYKLHVVLQLGILLLTVDIPVVSSDVTCKVYNQSYVDCSQRELDSIPDNLPSFATDLDLYRNDITSLPPGSLASLQQLEHLGLANNNIETLHSGCLQGLHQLKILIIKTNALSYIEPNAFRDVPKLEILDMSSNHDLRGIPNYVFTPLKNLVTLHLRYTGIEMLSSSSLQGLVNLQELYLNGGSITEVADDTFKDLKKLRILDLSNNNFACFPSKSLKPLTNVEIIRFSGQYLTSDSDCDNIDLRDFQKLEIVSLDRNNINDSNIQSMTFRDVPLHELVLSGNNLKCPINGTLNAVRATMLDLTDNLIDGECLEKLLYDLEHSDVKVLHLGNISPELPVRITSTTFRGLRTSKLKELLIQNMYVEETNLSAGVFQWMPHLKTLELTLNHQFKLPRTMFNGLQNLKTLGLRENDFDDIELGIFNDLTSLTTLQIQWNMFKTLYTMNDILENLQNLTTLQYLYLDDNNIEGGFVSYSLGHMTSLIELDMSHSSSTVFVTPQAMGVEKLPNLQSLSIDVSPSRKYTINPSLKVFYLTSARQTSVRSKDFTHFFDNRTSLQTLTIDNIQFETIPNNSVPSLVSLTLKDVYFKNPADVFEFINLFPNIKELSLTGVEGLTNKFMVDLLSSFSHLETLIIMNTEISEINAQALTNLINLTKFAFEDNHLDCSSCNMKEFVEWMKTDRKVYVEQSIIKCVEPYNMNGKSVLTLTFGWECNLAFMIAVPVTCIFAFSAICIGLCVHFRWYIRYGCFLIKLKRGGYQLQVNDEEQPLNIRYDAFVCYNENDRDWVMQQLIPHLENIDPPNFKLCLHERDFMPGIDIFDNILESIETSHKTMLILSPGFAQSEWCYFEMRMAQDHLFRQKRNLLLLVLLHEIPDNDMPRVLRKMLLTQKYIKWTENEVGQRLFWEKLKVALRSDNRVNRVANI